MTQVPLLDELAVVAAVAVGVTVVLARLRLPTVAGLLAAGALVGPAGLGLVRSIAAIESLAEIGVVLLLFSIGLEFSLARLRDIFRQVALGGALQVGLTTAAAAGVALTFGEPAGRSLFYGFVFALSSTAIVLRALAERRELDAPHGKFIVGTLIFQDLCVVPMVLIVPSLAPGVGGGGPGTVLAALGRAALVVAGTILLARLVVPRLLAWVDASRSREVFLLAILSLCIGTAWLTSLAGLSLALGAFLGGLVVADTEYSHRAMGDVLPLRDAFVSLFFVSLGMLFDVRVVLANPILVGALLAGFVLVKGLLATLSAFAMRFPARVAWLAGVGLAQFGEFGFVLARLGQSSGVVEADMVSPLLAAGIVSMFLTPLLVRAAPHFTAGERLLAPLERLIGVRGIDELPARELPSGHVILVGFGVGGRVVGEVLRSAGRPFVALELNAANVRAAKRDGFPVYYADATSEEALGHAHVTEASLLVLLINDPAAAERVVSTVRRVAPELPVLMRSRYLAERDALLRIGASDVVAEEVEGAVEVVARTLRWLEEPRHVIDETIRKARQAMRTSERAHPVARGGLSDLRGLGDVKVELLSVRAGSRALGASPASLDLRAQTGALVVAVRRGTARLEEVSPAVPFGE
ncbi:MAG: cation:proton antiporter, partial [Deltaproteobacteria bacterium]|nr:cation:proton antiporter [Deltaproteobacteria bacterium]